MSDTPLTDEGAWWNPYDNRSEITNAFLTRTIERRLRFLQSASAETLSAMPDWSDESIDAELAKESEVSNG